MPSSSELHFKLMQSNPLIGFVMWEDAMFIRPLQPDDLSEIMPVLQYCFKKAPPEVAHELYHSCMVLVTALVSAALPYQCDATATEDILKRLLQLKVGVNENGDIATIVKKH